MRDRLGNEVPPEAVPFAEWLEEHDWHYLREWIWPWEDEDGHHDGFWSQMIWHERPPAWPREDGVWFFALTVSDHVLARAEIWQAFLDLAEQCSEADRTSCRVPLSSARAFGEEGAA